MTGTSSSMMSMLKDRLGEPDEASNTVPYWLPTSLPNVNIVVSDKMDLGFAGGRQIGISGPSSCGKTALATELMIQAQRKAGLPHFNDHEHSWLEAHAISQGLDVGNFYYRQPLSAEEGFQLLYDVQQLVRCHQIGFDPARLGKPSEPGRSVKLIKAIQSSGKYATLPPLVQVIDSVASLIPEEQDIDYRSQNMKTKNMAVGAFLSTELKRMARDCAHLASTLVLLNQLRKNPAIMFGDNSSETGGEALTYYASTRIRLRRVGHIYADWAEKSSEIIGDIVELHVLKNKVARPLRRTKYVFNNRGPVGLDCAATMIVLGKEAGVLGPKEGKTVDFGGRSRWPINDLLVQCRIEPKLVAALIATVMPAVAPSLLREDTPPAIPEPEAA